MSDVPDCIFPSSNSEGIADLMLSMQGDFCDYPLAYGSVKRACMEEAIALYAEQSAGGTSRASLQEAGVASYQIPGIISETFRPGAGSAAQMGLKSPSAYRFLSKYIARSVPII